MEISLRTILTGGKIVTPEHVLEQYALILKDERIDAIIPKQQFSATEYDIVIDTAGKWITPGLIDIHTHGANLFDTMDASTKAFDSMGEFYAMRGVTSYLLTTGTAPNKDIRAVIDCFLNYKANKKGASPLGIHMEGPYLNFKRKGAQPAEYLRNPDPEEYRQWFKSGIIKLMTIAPELPGAYELIQYGIDIGVEFAVGHSVATCEQMISAIDHGLRQATHTFNGMNPMHHRIPGVVGVVLSDDRIYAQVIADGVHVHPVVVKALVKAKGFRKTILITDSIRATGLENGEYDLLGQTVYFKEGVARINSGGLAGSVLTMDTAVRNIMKFCDVDFVEAIRMASQTPAEALNIEDKIGRIYPGCRADIVVFDKHFMVETTLVGGKSVYQK